MSAMKKYAFVVSTGGAVMKAVLENEYLRSQVHSIVFDYEDPDIGRIEELGLRVEVFPERDPEVFCDFLLDHVQESGVDYVLSYYTKFYSKRFRDAYKDRIVNLHPSVLPAFKGMDGFGDAIAYHARLTGNTIEFIDEVMDEGKMIMQTVCPVDTTAPISMTRHRVFVQQCKALIQTVRWLSDDRVAVDGRRITIDGVTFRSNEYSPELDCAEAKQFQPPAMQQPPAQEDN